MFSSMELSSNHRRATTMTTTTTFRMLLMLLLLGLLPSATTFSYPHKRIDSSLYQHVSFSRRQYPRGMNGWRSSPMTTTTTAITTTARRMSTSSTTTTTGRKRDIRFSSPLLEEGYPETVEEYCNGTLAEKPLLVYLPGFDGTWMSPFLQFPELGTVFDVRCLTISMEDRSTYQELKEDVLDYIRTTAITVPSDGGTPNAHPQQEQEGSRRLMVDVDANVTTTPANPKPSLFNLFKPLSNANNNNNDSGNTTATTDATTATTTTTPSKRKQRKRPVYLCGESFGGILASDVALTLLQESSKTTASARTDLKGLVLINAATCYYRPKLASEGPSVAAMSDLLYPLFGLARLWPLFVDDYSVGQLWLILRSQALPSVIDTAAREAYMGRVAFSIPDKLRFMSRRTLSWRLTEWLKKGCDTMDSSRLSQYQSIKSFRTLIVAGERDMCLPSIDEARRLSNNIFPNNHVHVVEGAGHGSTCGSRVDLTALMRNRFPELLVNRKRRRRGENEDRTSMKETAAQGEGIFLGMEPRYDGKTDMGLLPWLYWNQPTYFRKPPQQF